MQTKTARLKLQGEWMQGSKLGMVQVDRVKGGGQTMAVMTRNKLDFLLQTGNFAGFSCGRNAFANKTGD